MDWKQKFPIFFEKTVCIKLNRCNEVKSTGKNENIDWKQKFPHFLKKTVCIKLKRCNVVYSTGKNEKYKWSNETKVLKSTDNTDLMMFQSQAKVC